MFGLIGDVPDRIWRNNGGDGEVFKGYDDGEGRTSWYCQDGSLDSVTDTPTDDEQAQNDAGY